MSFFPILATHGLINHFHGLLYLPLTQKGESALMLAVWEDDPEFYWFMMPEEHKTRVVSQLVDAGAALDLQNEVYM